MQIRMRIQTAVLLLSLCTAAGTTRATTYHVKNSGNDDADGLSDATAWASVGRVNKTSFAPGDSILFRRGDMWRERLAIYSSGSPGRPITFGAYGSGPKPCINGSTVLSSGWTSVSNNVWSHPFKTDVESSQDGGAVANVFFNGVRGTEVASAASVNSANAWYYDQSSTLYVYSTGDPAAAFSSPGVEVSDRFCVAVNGKSYLTFDALDAMKSNAGGYWSSSLGGHLTIRNCTISFNGMSGIYSNSNFTTVQNVTTHHNGVGRHDHGLYLTGDSLLAEHVTAFDNGGSGLSFNSCSGTVRYCRSYNNGSIPNYRGSSWGFGADLTSAGTQVINFSYNILYDNYGHGLWVSGSGIVNICNNVITRTRKLSDASGLQIAAYGGSVTVRNNLFYAQRPGAVDLLVAAAAGTISLDYDLYYGTAGTSITWLGRVYKSSELASFRSAQGQETHGLTADPMLVDPAGNDFRLQRGSPCIDAGTYVNQNADFLGTPLTGPPDVGAYEFAEDHSDLGTPPDVRTGMASDIGSSGATLHGTVNPMGSATTYCFEYGPTLAYGTLSGSTAAGSGTSPLAVTGVLSGLHSGGTIHYRLVATNGKGTAYGSDLSFETSPAPSIGGEPADQPARTRLLQNYPNPFNPFTRISFALSRADNVVVKVYDAAGVEIDTLVSGYRDAGEYQLHWDSKGRASGMYFCILHANGVTSTRRMMLLK